MTDQNRQTPHANQKLLEVIGISSGVKYSGHNIRR